jgi:hypothetical protein
MESSLLLSQLITDNNGKKKFDSSEIVSARSRRVFYHWDHRSPIGKKLVMVGKPPLGENPLKIVLQ